MNKMFELEDYVDKIARIDVVKRRNNEPDYDTAQRCLGFLPIETIKRTFQATTQLAKHHMTGQYRRHFKSRYPQLNRRRLHEKYATDTWFSSVKAITGESCCQIFVGLTSGLTYCYGMKTESEGASKLQEFIRQVGAPFSLRNDNSKMQTSTAFLDICNLYNIGTKTTEPHHPHQNPAENRIGTLKSMSHRLMDRVGAPEFLWLRCINYLCGLLNVMASQNLNWRTPMEKGLGITPDISAYLHFSFYEPVYYLDDDEAKYPETKEKLGHWCGPTENCGDAMTYWILTNDTNQLIARSVVRSALTPSEKGGSKAVNFRAFFNAEKDFPSEIEGSAVKEKQCIISLEEEISKLKGNKVGINIEPHDLLGYGFVKERDGIQQRAEVKSVNKEKNTVNLEYNTGHQDIITYNELVNIINAPNEDGDKLWSFKSISGHRKVGSKWEVQVDWDTGETSWEPLSEIRLADAITLARYAHDKELLEMGKRENPKP